MYILCIDTPFLVIHMYCKNVIMLSEMLYCIYKRGVYNQGACPTIQLYYYYIIRLIYHTLYNYHIIILIYHTIYHTFVQLLHYQTNLPHTCTIITLAH